MAQQAHRGVDAKSGEITCAHCAEIDTEIAEARSELSAANAANKKAEVEIAGLEHEIRSLSYKLEQLKRDKEAEARAHKLFDKAADLFELWKRAAHAAECEREKKRKKKKRNQFTGDRFWLVLPFLTKKQYGLEMCQQAIIGRTFEFFSTRRSNGSTRYFFEWERIFGDTGEFEESAKRAPKDWRERVEKLMADG